MSKQDAEAKLNELDRRLQEGWNNLHAIKESQLEAVRDVVREQWNEQQKQASQKQGRAAKDSASKSKSQKQDKTKRLTQAQDEEQGH